MSSILNTPDTTNAYDKADIDKNKAMAALSYLGILILVPLLAAKDSAYAKFHAAQGLNLLIVEIAWSIVNLIITVILALIGVNFLVTLWTLISWLVGIALFVLLVLGIVNAAQGKAKELPLIGGFRILK